MLGKLLLLETKLALVAGGGTGLGFGVSRLDAGTKVGNASPREGKFAEEVAQLVEHSMEQGLHGGASGFGCSKFMHEVSLPVDGGN